MLKVFVVFAIFHLALAQTPVKSCGNGKPLPKAVYFGGKANLCSKPPCILKRGKPAVTEIDFASPINTKTVTPKATAKVFGMQMDLKLGVQAAAACKMLKKGCPVAKGDPTSFKLVKPVEKSAMVGTADVEYSLYGDSNQMIFCYKLKTTVVWNILDWLRIKFSRKMLTQFVSVYMWFVCCDYSFKSALTFLRRILWLATPSEAPLEWKLHSVLFTCFISNLQMTFNHILFHLFFNKPFNNFSRIYSMLNIHIMKIFAWTTFFFFHRFMINLWAKKCFCEHGKKIEENILVFKNFLMRFFLFPPFQGRSKTFSLLWMKFYLLTFSTRTAVKIASAGGGFIVFLSSIFGVKSAP